MEIKAVQKFIRMSPRKLRLVVSMVKDLSPGDALVKLPFTKKRAAEPLVKVIKTAMANAKVKGLSEKDLTFKEIQINEGPKLKRGRPVARGRWHPYVKRTSHIRVILETKEPTPIKKARKKIEKEIEVEKEKNKIRKTVRPSRSTGNK